MSARLTRACGVLRSVALRNGASAPETRAFARMNAWARVGAQSVPPQDAAWWRVSNADGERAKVYIYDYIDMWGVTAQDFAASLDAITAPDIDLHVNSPGGDVWDGNAIYQLLKTHPANVTAHVDGIAASAASYIVMAADDIAIAKPARMMIHDALTLVYGNQDDLMLVAEQLGEISQGVAELYAERAGGKPTAWREAMKANAGFGTWYSSSEAVKAGLADRIDNGTPAADPAPAEPEQEPAQQPTESPGPEDVRSQLVRAGARLLPPKR